jgi:hypothetical protein
MPQYGPEGGLAEAVYAENYLKIAPKGGIFIETYVGRLIFIIKVGYFPVNN